MLKAESAVNTGLSLKTLSVIFFILSFFAFIDGIISNLVDVYYDFSISTLGLSLFIAITGVLVAGTYIFLKIIEKKIRVQTTKQTFENRIAKATWAIYYLLVANMIFVIIQLLLFSQYYTGLLSIASTISYGLASFITGSLAYYFFSWFIRNRDLVVLLYGLAMVSASSYICLFIFVEYNEIFTYHPPVTTVESGGIFAEYETELERFLVVQLSGILIAIIFLSFWGGTIVILYNNIKRIGKTLFWILVTTPIIYFLGTLISLWPEMQVSSSQDTNSLIFSFYVTTFSQVASIALFAIAFVSIARAVRHHQVSNYMYITSYGFALSSIAFIATISGAGYPPFGLPCVSLVGPFSFLLFIGLYRSAVSTAEDSSLRRSIKVSAKQQLKLLGSIGSAEMERKIQKAVLQITKSNAENLTQQSGIEPSLSMDETKQYINEVLEETKKLKK